MKPNSKRAKTGLLPTPIYSALSPSNGTGEGESAQPAVTRDLPGVQVRLLVHADGNKINVRFDDDYSYEFVFRLSEFSEKSPPPIATLVADVIEEIWGLALAAGKEKTKRKVLEALQTPSGITL